MHDAITQLMRETNDGDEWGNVMLMAFAIADTLYHRDEPIPDDWEYRPGLGARQSDEPEEGDYALIGLLADLDAGTLTADDLRTAGHELMTRRESLIAAGKDY